jgi:hypothetical protein
MNAVKGSIDVGLRSRNLGVSNAVEPSLKEEYLQWGIRVDSSFIVQDLSLAAHSSIGSLGCVGVDPPQIRLHNHSA